MRTSPGRYLALALLGLSLETQPALAQQQQVAPTSQSASPAVTAPRVVTPAVDSVAFRHAVDSATRLALDSAYTDMREARVQWHAVMVGLLVLAGVFLVLLVMDIVRGHDVSIESHWGGFGGGVGGTRLSRTLVLAVLLLVTSGMLTAIAMRPPSGPRSLNDRPDTTSAKPRGGDTSRVTSTRALPTTPPTSR